MTSFVAILLPEMLSFPPPCLLATFVQVAKMFVKRACAFSGGVLASAFSHQLATKHASKNSAFCGGIFLTVCRLTKSLLEDSSCAFAFYFASGGNIELELCRLLKTFLGL